MSVLRGLVGRHRSLRPQQPAAVRPAAASAGPTAPVPEAPAVLDLDGPEAGWTRAALVPAGDPDGEAWQLEPVDWPAEDWPAADGYDEPGELMPLSMHLLPSLSSYGAPEAAFDLPQFGSTSSETSGLPAAAELVPAAAELVPAAASAEPEPATVELALPVAAVPVEPAAVPAAAVRVEVVPPPVLAQPAPAPAAAMPVPAATPLPRSVPLPPQPAVDPEVGLAPYPLFPLTRPSRPQRADLAPPIAPAPLAPPASPPAPVTLPPPPPVAAPAPAPLPAPPVLTPTPVTAPTAWRAPAPAPTPPAPAGPVLPTGPGPRRRGRRLLVSLLCLVLVAAAAGGAYAEIRHRENRAPAAHSVAATTAIGLQQTVLLGYGPTGPGTVSTALLATSAASDDGGAVLLVPSGTLVDGPGGTVGGSYALATSGEFAGAVADLLSVRVDRTWRLSPAGLIQLVDRLGGVTVNVDSAISDGPLQLTAGPQRLSGAQAAGYASYLASGDPEATAEDRLRRVLDGVVAALPKSPAAIAADLSVPGSTVTGGPSALAGFLHSLAGSNFAANTLDVSTTPLDVGGSSENYALNVAATAALTHKLLPGAVRTPLTGGRVEVVDDVGRADLATSTRTQLESAGLQFVRVIEDTPLHQHKASMVLVFQDTPAAIALGHRVAAALGIPHAEIGVSTQTNNVTDVLAILAGDYRP